MTQYLYIEFPDVDAMNKAVEWCEERYQTDGEWVYTGNIYHVGTFVKVGVRRNRDDSYSTAFRFVNDADATIFKLLYDQ